MGKQAVEEKNDSKEKTSGKKEKAHDEDLGNWDERKKTIRRMC